MTEQQPHLTVLQSILERGLIDYDQAFNREFDTQLDRCISGLATVMRHGMPMDIAVTCALDQAWWDTRKALHQDLDRNDAAAVAFDAWLFTEGTTAAYMPLLRYRYAAEVQRRIELKAAEHESQQA
jgi:hypothetical protein